MTERGTYTLLVELPGEATVTVGALGTVPFRAGWYAYTGSAMGTVGFARVDRHRAVAAGRNDVRHWHLDYLLGETGARIDAVVTTAGRDVECAVSRAIAGDPVPGFGASDCECSSHLRYGDTRSALVGSIRDAHDSAQSAPETDDD